MGFVRQQRNKPHKLNNLKAVAVTKEELEFVRELLNKPDTEFVKEPENKQGG